MTDISSLVVSVIVSNSLVTYVTIKMYKNDTIEDYRVFLSTDLPCDRLFIYLFSWKIIL